MMAFKINYTPESLDDLDLIAEYLAEKSAIAPFTVLSRIRAKIDHIKKMPRMYPVCEDDGRLRKITVDEYSVLYSLDEKKEMANIEFVYHSSRDLVKVLNRQLLEYDFEIDEEEEELEF